MNIKATLAAAALAVFTTVPASAVTIELDFKFDGVSGTFYGLDTGKSDVQHTSAYDFAGIADDYIGIVPSPFETNDFLFELGVLRSVEFLDIPNADGVRTVGFLSDLVIDMDGSPAGGPYASSTELRNFTKPLLKSSGAVTFTQRLVAPVPLPAGGLLLLTGLAGMAVIRRRNARAT